MVWVVSFAIQAYITTPKYIGFFTNGCQVTGYPVDICEFNVLSTVPSFLVVLFNIAVWFIIVNFIWSIFKKFK